MANLYVTEYASLMLGAGGRLTQIADEPALADQQLPISTNPQGTLSAPFNAQTRFVRLHSDSNCSIAFGVNPQATAANMRLTANQTEMHGVPLGQGYRLMVIGNN